MSTIFFIRSKALTPHAYNKICEMIDNGDSTIGRIFRNYETNKDVMPLVKDLQALNFSTANQEAAEVGDQDDEKEEAETQEATDDDRGAVADSVDEEETGDEVSCS